ncbi:MAG: DUF3488 and transglutaminase-like domain-containing protein, partial [Myxococcota bacterium]|nr:DUF3488 and transglutaminase-like domain-containing protein [Myxococcota bacterium]
SGGGTGLGVSGFSEQVALGDLGRIRLDPRLALRVETDVDASDPGAADRAAGERYVRGLAFDHFDGRRWSVSPGARARVVGDPIRGVLVSADPLPLRRGPRLVQRIAREPMDSGVIFSPGRLLSVRGSLGRLELDSGGALHAHRTTGNRVDYQVTARLGAHGDTVAHDDRAVLPQAGERFLDLPALSESVEERTREITRRASSDAERVRVLEAWLRREGRYSDEPPVVPPGSERSPIEVFLDGGLAGHCEYFASAMAVMLRSIDIPARVVNGFAGGSENRLGGFVEYAQSDAHTWVEVHFADAGWVRYDPTPPDLRLAGADALRESGGLQSLVSAMELWWFRNVVDFDRSTQARAIRSLWQRWKSFRGGNPGGLSLAPSTPDAAGPGFSVSPTVVWGLALGLALALGFAVWRGREDGHVPVPEYQQALRLLARRGIRRDPNETARLFAARVAEWRPAASAPFARLTGAYLATRFGDHPAPELGPELDSLRRILQPR